MTHRLRWRNTPREVVEPAAVVITSPTTTRSTARQPVRGVPAVRPAGVSCTRRVVLLDQRRVQLGLQRLEGPPTGRTGRRAARVKCLFVGHEVLQRP